MKKLAIQSPHFSYIETSFQEWLDVLGYAESTVYALPNHIREFFHWLESAGIHHLSHIETQHINTYYQHLKARTNTRCGGGLSNAYLNKHLQALYKFAEYIHQNGRHTFPPLGIAWEPDDTEEITVLSPEEIRELYQATYGYNEGTRLEPFNARDRAMLTIFYGCGLRRSEGYYLDLSDINFDRRILHVRKGKNYKERFVPFNKTGQKYLEEYIYDWRPLLISDKKEDALFISQKGRRMETQSMAIRLKLLQQRTDNIELQQKDVRPHILRHSIATHLLENGMELEKISRFLGHSSLESTQVYTHLAKNKNGEVVIQPQPYRNIPKYQTIQLSEDE